MASQVNRQHATRDPIGDAYPIKARSNNNGGGSSTRIPLRPRQLNTDNNNNAPPTSKLGAQVEKNYQRPSSSSGREDRSSRQGSSSNQSEGVEIEELRRKPGGTGHTVHKYIRGKLLGKGGFAKVYMCTSLDTNRLYAVKIVPKANLVKARARQKLQAEIKIHRMLKNKFICEYKHFFEDKNNCYILLELCHNQSMNELIKRRKRLTEPEVKYFLSQLLHAVQYMHSINVIHRDLKLGNLFLDKNLRIKVGDLGLATKLSSSDEKRKTICGTPNYIAPEVIDGDKEKRGHSFEVDVWSMGVICYTLLIGKPPYESKDVKSTYQRILANKYSFPSHVPISEHARDLISRMLQTRPDKRPTLDFITNHPFFTHDPLKIPKSLPSCCTHVAPDWQEDENGELVPVLAEADEQKYHAKQASRGNHEKYKISPRRAAPQSTRHGREGTENGQRQSAKQFNIYDDGKENSPHPSNGFPAKELDSVQEIRQRATYERDYGPGYSDRERAGGTTERQEDDVEQLRRTDSDSPKYKLQQLSSKEGREVEDIPQSGDLQVDSRKDAATNNNDKQILETMHERLKQGFSDVERAGGPKITRPNSPLSSGGASKWVSKYVDYTSKYGLGFLLNDGSAGVYFNDSTKAVLAPKGESFIYADRKKSNDEEGGHVEQICDEHTLSSFPDNLQKKVTLLKHFRNYLIEQQKREGENDITIDGESEDVSVFLKKWVRTKHAILFRLSNNTVQVVFYDHTEILLTEDGNVVTYIDKRKGRTSFRLENILNNVEQNDIKKRLKYTESILHQLISGTKK